MDKMNNWREAYRKKMGSSDTSELNITAALALKSVNMPKYLYKYRYPTEYAIQSLETDSVYLNSPKDYNDPFEFWESFDIARLNKAIEIKHQDDLITQMTKEMAYPEEIVKCAKASPDNAIYIMLEYAYNQENPKPSIPFKELYPTLEKMVYKRHDNFNVNKIKNFQQLMKVCSFCESPSHLLMWSHYTDNHKGFCVEYDISKWSLNDIRRNLMYPVTYQDTIYDSTDHLLSYIAKSDFNNVYPIISGSTKSLEWEYEQEWRLIFNIGESFPKQSYQMNCQTKVYLGCRMSAENKERILEICKRKGVEVYLAKPSLQRYELIFEPQFL